MCSGKRPLLEQVVPRQPKGVDPELCQPRQELDPWNTGKTCRCAGRHSTDFVELHCPCQPNLVGKLRGRQLKGLQAIHRGWKGLPGSCGTSLSLLVRRVHELLYRATAVMALVLLAALRGRPPLRPTHPPASPWSKPPSAQSFFVRVGNPRRTSFRSSGFSARGSSTCSMTWKGRTILQTSLVLPLADQFHLPLVLEQEKAILVRQRPVGLDKANDLLLFLFGQSRHVVVSFSGVYSIRSTCADRSMPPTESRSRGPFQVVQRGQRDWCQKQCESGCRRADLMHGLIDGRSLARIPTGRERAKDFRMARPVFARMVQ